MHESALIRSFVIEATVFIVTTLLTYAACYGLSALIYGLVLKAHPVHRARHQLPLAWLLFNTYLVAGLFYYGALPTSFRALLFATGTLFLTTVGVLAVHRLLRRRARAKPSAARLVTFGLLPWLAAWLWHFTY